MCISARVFTNMPKIRKKMVFGLTYMQIYADFCKYTVANIKMATLAYAKEDVNIIIESVSSKINSEDHKI